MPKHQGDYPMCQHVGFYRVGMGHAICCYCGGRVDGTPIAEALMRKVAQDEQSKLILRLMELELAHAISLKRVGDLEGQVTDLQSRYLDKFASGLKRERYGAWMSGLLQDMPLSQLLDEIKRRYNDVDNG